MSTSTSAMRRSNPTALCVNDSDKPFLHADVMAHVADEDGDLRVETLILRRHPVDGHPGAWMGTPGTSTHGSTGRRRGWMTAGACAVLAEGVAQPGMARSMSVDQVTWVRVGARMPRVARRSSMNTVPIAAAATTRATFSVATVTST